MQARLRAQLGDRSKYSGERRRRSVVVASIVLTITDPLRGSYPLLCNLQAALIRSYGASFACMELTTICRFQRLQASRKSLLHSLFLYFIVFQCFRRRHVPTLWCCHFWCLRGRFGEKRRTSVCGGAPRYGGDVSLIFDIFCAVLRAGCSSSVRRWSLDLRRPELG